MKFEARKFGKKKAPICIRLGLLFFRSSFTTDPYTLGISSSYHRSSPEYVQSSRGRTSGYIGYHPPRLNLTAHPKEHPHFQNKRGNAQVFLVVPPTFQGFVQSTLCLLMVGCLLLMVLPPPPNPHPNPYPPAFACQTQVVKSLQLQSNPDGVRET